LIDRCLTPILAVFLLSHGLKVSCKIVSLKTNYKIIAAIDISVNYENKDKNLPLMGLIVRKRV
jgi:hypothetical protein